MSDTEELMMLMEKRADEREEKLFKLYTESEDKRRDKERDNETNMTRMMLSFMERMNNMQTQLLSYPQDPPFNQSQYYQ